MIANRNEGGKFFARRGTNRRRGKLREEKG